MKHDSKSALESEFAYQVRALLLPKPQREVVFASKLGRRWRWDFCWEQYQVAVELHGLVVVRGARGEGIVRGGHGTIDGITRDMDKQNCGVLLGWAVLSFTQKHVKSGDAIDMVQRVLATKGWALTSAEGQPKGA